jgi:endonuclease/exonuclease/phosphatase family metal-dependent hydrolase
MRRVAPAMGPVFALFLATVPALPGHAADGAHRSASRVLGLDTASSKVGATYVSVSWNWSRPVTGYRLQVSPRRDFSSITASRTTRPSASRPAGGRASATVGHLHDATYYYVRVRRVGADKSAWSPTMRVATKAHAPDAITSVSARMGHSPGETRISWVSDGGHTDYFKINTALTPFGSKDTPPLGRHPMTFRAPGTARSITLTSAQTRAAGAGVGTGRHLFFRVTAVRSGAAASQSRRYPFLEHAAIAGLGPTTAGSPIRFAAYNVHVASTDAPGHPWSDRAQLVANNIASHQPAIVALPELMPAMWTNGDGGPGLDLALHRAGAGRYALTRTTTYSDATPGDTRILYDPSQVQMVSTCDPSRFSCGIRFPLPGGRYGVAPYAKFKDLSSGEEFWFVAAHFYHGDDAATDAVRGVEAQDVAEGMKAVNGPDLPVIVAGDFNSAQNSAGHDSSHAALLRAGYFDTAAAKSQVNVRFNTVNKYTRQQPSPYGFGALYDSIMTLGMRGATRFEQVLTGAPWPSDHNMVLADVRLP